MLSVPGSRRVGWPFSRTSGTAARTPSHSRSRRPVTRAASSAMSRARISTALPNPTMPGTFSVPARRRRSCSPPCWTETILVPLPDVERRRRPSARRSCAPEKDSRSIPKASQVDGASCRRSAPRPRGAGCRRSARDSRRSPRSAGCVPTSLLACMIEIRMVSGRMARAHVVGIDQAVAVDGR